MNTVTRESIPTCEISSLHLTQSISVAFGGKENIGEAQSSSQFKL